jgi:uncharacterized protein YaaR (DUF327 family)
LKVGESLRAFADRLERKEETLAQGRNSNFQEYYASARVKETKARLEALIRSVDEAGNRLKERMTWNDLREYKRRIKVFLEMVIKEGFAMKEETGFDRRGRARLYRIIHEIDNQLTAISDALMSQEKDRMKILASVAEIKGLLINLSL